YMGDERGRCRIIAIPVIQGAVLPPPNQDVTNWEFALFWLDSLDQCTGNNCEIKGYWIGAEVRVSGLLGVLDPSITPFTVVKLVE
ncbi:MAG TPA: hypothetical protein VJM69_01235, partial [Dehalococcoidia bacterium]|nr:hypothetical protein [Dehalococcoidia bacterium]